MFETNYDAIERNQLAQRSASGARWFYWIAALSVITSIASLSGGGFRFLTSLGITQLVDGFVRGFNKGGGNIPMAVALIIDVTIAGILAVFGFFALKRQTWAFLAGIVFFGLDTLLFLIGPDFLGLAFHVFVLYCLIKGYSACAKLVRLERELTVPGPPQPDPTFGSNAEPTP